MNKIGIIGAGTKALPPEVLRMTEEANVEIVELDKDYSPTDTPQFEEFTCKIQWYVSKDIVAYIYIRNLADWSAKAVYFNDKPCPLVQVTENLDCYKQVDGAIYEISNGSPVE